MSETPRTDAVVVLFREHESLSTMGDYVAADFARQLERDLETQRAALQELVDTKDMHDRIENRGNGISAEEARSLNREYRQRRPLAWEAARAALKATINAAPPTSPSVAPADSESGSAAGPAVSAPVTLTEVQDALLKLAAEIYGPMKSRKLVEQFLYSDPVAALLYRARLEPSPPSKPDSVDGQSGDKAKQLMEALLNALLNHVEPGWENCKAVVQAWLDETTAPSTRTTINEEKL